MLMTKVLMASYVSGVAVTAVSPYITKIFPAIVGYPENVLVAELKVNQEGRAVPSDIFAQ